MKKTCKCGRPRINPGVQNRCRECQRSYQKAKRHKWKKQPPEYRVWRAMISRCCKTADRAFVNYGGRGIKVCDRWLYSYASFSEDMGPRPLGMTVERKNNNGDYEPSNCIWASRFQQSRNRRNNIILTFSGRSQCLTDWAAEMEISRVTLRWRIVKLKWTTDRALTSPVSKRAPETFLIP
jgi:hypothetical protein